ncbi:GPI transamidase component PIG-T [Hyalella azteca]|uniref:GPI transamidase component PIG-T n=1 Tax=Hyalella azteca TaxID=294128 RepID=A0A8B7PJM7_HYAAZ|nr:GPI transamidase component PIG-T [Hyalella azteca]
MLISINNMAVVLRLTALLILLVSFSSFAYSTSNNNAAIDSKCSKETQTDESSFSEELLVRPLPSGHVHSHFEFTTKWSNPSIKSSLESYHDLKLSHYDLFPRALGEVVEKYHVRELHLTLTQGLWRHHKWGYPVADAPPGATLWVWFNPAPKNVLDDAWRDLVNALSGLFCASLNFIDGSNTASPELSYRPSGLAQPWYASNSSYLRVAALARENVCTENLTPWKKLLPCDTKAGLASVLYPSPLYSAHYHSLGVHLRPSCQDPGACTRPQLELVLSVSLVQQRLQEGRQDFTLRGLYSSPIFSVCPMAYKSMLYVDVTGNEDGRTFSLSPPPSEVVTRGAGLGSASHRVFAVYDLQETLSSSRDALNVAARYAKRHTYAHVSGPPLVATRYIAGYGQEGGSIRVVLSNSGSEDLSVVYLELLPWYLRLYLHTAHETGQGERYLSQFVGARDREQGWVYEAVVRVPARGSTELSLPFTRALLKWLEYPPDANHGFYLPAATVSAVLPTARNITAATAADTGSLLDKLSVREGEQLVRLYTETLLVTLPTPDFSMPYNVICLACTVVALAFGPIHNITTKRLVLKKIQPSESFASTVSGKVRRLFGFKVDVGAEADEGAAKTDTCAAGTDAAPVAT